MCVGGLGGGCQAWPPGGGVMLCHCGWLVATCGVSAVPFWVQQHGPYLLKPTAIIQVSTTDDAALHYTAFRFHSAAHRLCTSNTLVSPTATITPHPP
jgi:hypothetical protein